MHKLSVEAPPKILVERYLIEIAKNYNVPYEPDSVVMVSLESLEYNRKWVFLDCCLWKRTILFAVRFVCGSWSLYPVSAFGVAINKPAIYFSHSIFKDQKRWMTKSTLKRYKLWFKYKMALLLLFSEIQGPWVARKAPRPRTDLETFFGCLPCAPESWEYRKDINKATVLMRPRVKGKYGNSNSEVKVDGG